ncbi:hypothetical protein LRH25_10170 [Ideonella azotifigens]|uniref:MFS transporter n=2 Tax=Ideonella azotifigens TaxID=513160 RepID=A0ABN1KF50_9BURK|nr:hypothetical protein [Ideonella azotifigens]MCD2340709.1 hypothetical protein [Ideonella azotifigens]
MDGICKAVLTAAVVWLVMGAVRHGGHRLAGVAAALPTITAPTLAWLAHEQGVVFATQAAVASVAACAMLAVFAMVYALLAQRGGAGRALVGGLAAAAALAWPVFAASAQLADALVLALGCCAVAWYTIRRHGAHKGAQRDSRCSRACAATAVGGITALTTTLGPLIGSFAAGLMASLPLISGAVAVVEHSASGPAAAARFLHGYVGGLFGKAAFGTVFALLAAPIGAPWALLWACASACAVPLLFAPSRTAAHA